MPEVRRGARAPLSLIVMAALLAVLVACGGDAGGGEDEASADAGRVGRERQKKANALWAQAQSASPPQKIPFLRTLVSHYPDFKQITDAHMQLVFFLLDDSVEKPQEALEATRIFGERHPENLKVSECYRWLVFRAQRDGKPQEPRRLLEEWKEWLAQSRPRQDEVEKKARVWLETAKVFGQLEQPEVAARWLEEAAAFETPSTREHQEILVLLAGLQGGVLGRKQDALDNYGKALALARAGTKGYTVEQITQEIDKLR